MSQPRRSAVLAYLLCLMLSAPLRLIAHPTPPKPTPEVQALLDKGQAASDAFKYEEAHRLYTEALEKARALNDKAGEADALGNTGALYFALGQPQKALECFQKALTIIKQNGDRRSLAYALQGIGMVYSSLGQPQKTLQYLQRAAILFKQAGDRRGEADALGNTGSLYYTLGQPQKALQYLQQALVLYRLVENKQIGDKRGEATVLANFGNVYVSLGQPQKALESYEQALALYKQVGDRGGEADMHFGIGIACSDSGQIQKALLSFQQARSDYRQTGHKVGEANALNRLGMVSSYQVQPQKALEAYEQALALYRQVGDRGGEANVLTNIGEVYYSLGQPQKALAYYQKALPLHRVIGAKQDDATTLGNIGIVYSDIGQNQQALRYLRQERSIHRLLKNKPGEANSLINIGTISSDIGQNRKALHYLQYAVHLYKQMGNRAGQANTLGSLGGVYARIGQPQKALQYLKQALDIYRQTGYRDGEADVLTNIGVVNSHLGQPDKALEAYRQAIALLETFRASLGGLSEAKSSFLASNLSTYQRYLALLLQQGKTTDAFNLVQKMKARALLDLMHDGKVLLAQSLSPEEREKEQRLRDAADRLNAAMLKESVQNQVGAKKRFAALKQQLAKAESDLQTYTDTLYARHPQLAQKRAARTLTLSETGRFLPADTALLEYIVLNGGMGKDRQDKTVLLLTTLENGKPQVRVFPLQIASASLPRLTEAFRQTCADPRRDYRPPARQLYSLLLAPASRSLTGKTRLVICPDGPLWDVPFQALHDNSHFLAERFEIAYAYSATGAQAALTTKHGKPTGTVLALVNPDMGEAKRFGDNPTLPGQRPLDSPSRPLDSPSRPLDSPSRPLDSPSRDLFTQRGGKLLALPGTRQEGQALTRLFPNAQVYSGQDAQEATAKREAAAFRYLHLASHAFFNDAAPLLSSVVLAQPADDKEDGFLTAREIFDLDLSAEMVVLSACNTARGEKRSGEGVVGLTWALFVAGAPTQVLSQWSVDDASTAELMTGFYTHLKAGKAKGKALREAGLELMKREKGKYRHPYYWAPFVLVGDWR